MAAGCQNPVTHIGAKGYTYCATCAPRRIGVERCRKLRSWEIAELKRGHAISYEPRTKLLHFQNRAYTGQDPKFSAALAAITREGR
jgi:hypothetical protein